jgi:hypothetical protein
VPRGRQDVVSRGRQDVVSRGRQDVVSRGLVVANVGRRAVLSFVTIVVRVASEEARIGFAERTLGAIHRRPAIKGAHASPARFGRAAIVTGAIKVIPAPKADGSTRITVAIGAIVVVTGGSRTECQTSNQYARQDRIVADNHRTESPFALSEQKGNAGRQRRISQAHGKADVIGE